MEYVMKVTGRLTDADRERLVDLGVAIGHEAKLRDLVVVVLPMDLSDADVEQIRALDFVESMRPSRTFRLV